MTQKQNGFTLIELLVVIAIIGILSALILVNMANARKQARDTKRLADTHQIMTALQLYYNDNASYPDPATPSGTGPTPDSGDPVWSTYLAFWPQAPLPPDNPEGSSDCTPENNVYTYTSIDSGRDYNLTFCLGQQIGAYSPGMHTASINGIQ